MTGACRSVGLIAVVAASACSPALVWHGRSPDRQRMIRVEDKRGQFVVLDGVRGPTYSAIGVSTITFSPDSQHLAYSGARKGRWRMIVDGEEGPLWDGIGEVVYAPDSAGLAYAAERDGSWRVVEGDLEGPTFEGLFAGTLRYSPDSRHLAYVGTRADGTHVVVDGRIGPSWDGVGDLSFSADGAHVAYLGRRDTTAAAVFDGVVGPEYDAIDELVLSAAGGRVAYVARRRDLWHVVVDGSEGAAWGSAGGVAFSSDGGHVAYAGKDGAGWVIVLDGAPGAGFFAIRPASITFGPGADTPTYVAGHGDGHVVVVHEDQEGASFDDVQELAFSRDGSRWGYLALREGAWIPVIDGVEAAAEAWATDLVFSRDGGHVAYIVRRDGDMAVIVDGTPYRFDVVLDDSLVFDATGRHWGCVSGVRAKRRFHVVVDGVEQVPLDFAEILDAAMRVVPDSGDADRMLGEWVLAEIDRMTR